MMINRFGYSLEESEIEDITKRVTKAIESEEFASLTKGRCFKEKAIRYRDNLRYIDLLVKGEDGAWRVCDYKSSMAYSEHHLKQVRYYVKAVKEITGGDVSGYICYLLEEGVKIVSV